MLQQSYQFSLNYEVQPSLSITAKLFQDSTTSVLVCVTTIGKVLIYMPRVGKDQVSTQFLNISKKISSIALCQFRSATSPSDKLILASQNTLIVYDVERNLEIFNKDIPDGIFASCFGEIPLGRTTKQLAFIGGDCSILGFDSLGEESYWNVTGDQVTALCSINCTAESPSLLVVASADSTIRVFKHEEIVFEMQLPSSATTLIPLNDKEDALFAFGLENGYVGVYRNSTQLWMIKESIRTVSLVLAQFESSEATQPLLVGRINGNIEVRRYLTGELLYKHNSHGVNLASLLFDDLNGSLRKQVIGVYQDGTVRGYNLGNQNLSVDPLKFNETYESLLSKKLELTNRLTGDPSKGVQIIPHNTRVMMGFAFASNIIELVLQSTEQSTYIRQVILQADSLFLPYSCYVHTPQNLSYITRVPLTMIKENLMPKKEIKARILISSSSASSQQQVLETRNSLPKFCQFALSNKSHDPSTGYVRATIKERVQRIVKWLDQCFVLQDSEVERLETLEQINLTFQHVQTQEFLGFQANPQIGHVQISCVSIELAGQVLEDLCSFIHIEELSSEGIFPEAVQKLHRCIESVELLNQAKHQLNADVGESVNAIKTNVVRAEDARMVGEWDYMRKLYAGVMVQNRQIQADMLKKNTNNQVLMDALRQINGMIASGGSLRVGRAKEKVIAMCRNAVKKKNLHSLESIIQYGRES